MKKCPTEKSLYPKILAAIPGKHDRIENAASPGMADIVFTYDNRTYWVEVKIWKKVGTPVVVDMLEPSQTAWTAGMITHGGSVGCIFALVYHWKNAEWHLFRAESVVSVDDYRVKIVYSLVTVGKDLYQVLDVFL